VHDFLRDIAICIGTAWLLGVVAQWVRQSVLLAYLVGGLIIGPGGLGWIHSRDSIETISELGLIFLLFMIGLEIDLKKIASAGRSITVTAAVQILGGTALGVALGKLVGLPLGGGQGWDALYLGVAGALSSTVIVVKVLYDKRELDTTAGRMTLGILVLQDLAVILFLAVQPSLDSLQVSALVLSILKAGLLVLTALLLSRFALPPLFRHVARLPELVMVGALAWCFLMGELGQLLGLSREMGALVAGVAISTYPYALDVTAKITSLRDFFLTLYFVGLGLDNTLPSAHTAVIALGIVAFVVVSRALTLFPPLYFLRSGLRHSLLPSINLCQLSEFSLVLMELGVRSGHIKAGNDTAFFFAFVLLAVLSSSTMTRSDGLVRWLIPWLKRFGLHDLDDGQTAIRSRESTEGAEGHAGARILILGFFRTASSLVAELERSAPDLIRDVAVVDFNPVVHAELKRRGIRVLYGDLGQRDTLMHAGIAHAEVLVCTVPDSLLKGTTNLRLVRTLREINPTAKIIAPAEVLSEIPALHAAGADYVSVPRLQEAADLCEAVRAADSHLLREKQAHLDALLKERHEVLP
jgi:Kef-type K+ transport system membrane component KefB